MPLCSGRAAVCLASLDGARAGRSGEKVVASRARGSRLEIYDVAAELGETGTLGMVPSASGWPAEQVGKPEQHPATCGAELAGPIGVLDTTNSMRFARHSSAVK